MNEMNNKVSIDNGFWDKEYEILEKIGVRGYLQKHFEVCKYIWTNLVPNSGQADNLQGEMLRMIVKLRNEAVNNGNINWDDNFEWFCNFIKETLVNSGLFDEGKNYNIQIIMEYIKNNGEYSFRYANGEIDDNEVDIMKLAYTDDDIYEYIEDAIGEYYLSNSEPIAYDIKDFIYR